MGRPIEATSALDLDTIKLLLWVSEFGTGQPNISRLYEVEAAEGLDMGRGTFFGAVRGRKVTQETLQKIDELIAVRGWQAKWLDHLQQEHRQRVIQAFGRPNTGCVVCGHVCPKCGKPHSEQRRKAIKDYLKIDPVDLGCKVVSPEDHEE